MSRRILILDDEPLVGLALCRTLARAGFEATAVLRPDEALAQLATGEIAVLLSDYRMPECTGVDFLERCAREHPEVSQILITGCSDQQVAVEAINRTEVMKFLSKPWEEADLVSTVRDAVWDYELRQEA